LDGKGKTDFVAFDYSYPDGLDIDTFSFTALEKAWKEAKLSSEREHVAPYIYKNPHLFKLDAIGPCFKNLRHLRWTLDEPKDLRLIRKIYELARSKNWPHPNLKNILRLYDDFPELSKINNKIIRNNDYPKSLERERVKFIAEVSSNHNRDLDRCLKFVDKAAAIGCWGIKFQLFKIDELFAPEILAKSAMHRKRRRWELPVEFLPTIAQRCREKNIKFVCTPFYLKAVEELEPYVDFYKIASYELPWLDLFRACAKTGKPVIFSTGIAILDEVQAGVNTLVKNGCKNISILHCTSSYPTPAKECNLSAIHTMRSQIKVPDKVRVSFGWSDHSVSPMVIYRAVKKWRASMVEFHLDLEGAGAESNTGHCWLPKKIEPVIADIINDVKKDEHYGSTADGNGVKEPVPSELAERPWRADPSDGLRPFKEIRQTWRPDKAFEKKRVPANS
jgi:N-acetylneuraminate synthase